MIIYAHDMYDMYDTYMFVEPPAWQILRPYDGRRPIPSARSRTAVRAVHVKVMEWFLAVVSRFRHVPQTNLTVSIVPFLGDMCFFHGIWLIIFEMVSEN